jgi:hypothetical protein
MTGVWTSILEAKETGKVEAERKLVLNNLEDKHRLEKIPMRKCHRYESGMNRDWQESAEECSRWFRIMTYIAG